MHRTRPGAPPPPAQQQVKDWNCPHRKNQPAGVRPETALCPGSQGHAGAGAGKAEACLEEHCVTSSQAGGAPAPHSDMSE